MTDQLFKIFIFCDDPRHRDRRVAVTNFIALPAGGWTEKPAGRAVTGTPGAGLIGTGRQMVADKPAEVGWALQDNPGERRERFELLCRKCSRKGGGSVGQPMNAGTLFRCLDNWRSIGVSEVSLAQLAASVSRK